MTAQPTTRPAQKDRPTSSSVRGDRREPQPEVTNPFVTKVDELITNLRHTMDLALELRDLALQQGDQRLVEQSEAMVRQVQGLGSEFDQQVAGRSHDQVDDRTVEQLQGKASHQEAEIRQLFEQLQRQVDTLEQKTSVYDNLFGIEIVDNKPVVKGDKGLVPTVARHEQRLVELEQVLEIDDDGNSQRLVRQETVISQGDNDASTKGALVAFLVVGVIAFLIGWLTLGFVPGLAVGLFLGITAAVIAVLAKNRRRESTTRDNDTTRVSSREERN